ncbi:hypothetical protein [Rhodococcus opacus]|uniref:hypothetical protein n=1 Tax=Rhodococcus opacus TaxID=37919 RepID=UPI0022355F13|nr:hypothetical protein [Rhodococcus opacus]UZG60146.1 hypothetical protein ONE62_41330 [Rhodococcus opacus]
MTRAPAPTPPVLDFWKDPHQPVTAVPGPHLPITQTTLDTGRDDPASTGEALLESWEAGIAVTIGLALLTILVCTVLGSFPLALLALVAVAGIAGLITAAL